MNQPKPPRVTEVAFTKNEGRFLLEWIAYHRLIGVSDFLIYTNDCEDESPALLDRLQEMGIVTQVPNPLQPGERAQNKALNAAASHPLVTAADYVLQIDPDEFLVVKTGAGKIADLIATAPGADIICVQMRFFGDSGLAVLGDGLVTEALTKASHESFEKNRNVKSLARNGGPFIKITSNHMPGFDPDAGQFPRIFNSGGQELRRDAYDGGRFRMIPEAFSSMRFAQLNHYCTRTLSDYRAKKYRGTAANNDKKLHMNFFVERNRNEVQDHQIQSYVPAIKAQMQEWLKDPVLAKRNENCFAAYAAIVEKTKDMTIES